MTLYIDLLLKWGFSEYLEMGQSSQGARGRTYTTFCQLNYGITNYTRPVPTIDKLTAVLEYPYPISDWSGYIDLDFYKQNMLEQVREHFPSVEKVVFSEKGKNELCNLYVFVEDPKMVPISAKNGVQKWTLHYTLSFQDVYVISQSDQYVIYLFIPKDIYDILKKCGALRDFHSEASRAYSELLHLAHVSEDKTRPIDEGKRQKMALPIQIPMNHIVDEANKMALDETLVRARAMGASHEIKMFEFISRNAATPGTLRTAKIVQLKDIECEYALGDACGEKLLLTELFPEYKDKIWSLPITEVEVTIDHYLAPFVIGFASITVGGVLMYGGREVMILSIVSAPETAGVSLIAFPIGLLVFATGSYLVVFGKNTLIKHVINILNDMGKDIDYETNSTIGLPDFPPAHDTH